VGISDYNVAQQEKRERDLTLPLRGIISSVAPENESVNIDSFGTSGTPEFAVRHPYLGVNSWVRAMPDTGSSVLIQKRGDLHQQEIWGYISNKLAASLREANKDRTFPMRILQEGEVEVMSTGRAAVFAGSGGDLELRGGALSTAINQTELENTSIAPTYKRRLHLHDPSKLGHEERFGVVKRSDPNNPYSIQKFIRLSDNNFAVEYGRWLNDRNDEIISVLREGHIYDANGTEEQQSSTNKNLRYKRTIQNKAVSATLDFEIDEALNIYYNNASNATESKLNFGTANELTVEAKKMTLKGSNSLTASFTNSMSITSNKVRVNSPDTGFGSNPIHPAVLGNNLKATLNPTLSGIVAFLNVVSGDPATGAPTRAAAQAASAAVSSALQSIDNMLSTQVKFTR
jgi:hypothetical protein